MQKEYIISGMTCNSCVANVKQSLEELEEVKSALIKLKPPQGKLELLRPVSTEVLQKVIGDYAIEEVT